MHTKPIRIPYPSIQFLHVLPPFLFEIRANTTAVAIFSPTTGGQVNFHATVTVNPLSFPLPPYQDPVRVHSIHLPVHVCVCVQGSLLILAFHGLMMPDRSDQSEANRDLRRAILVITSVTYCL